MTSNHSNFFRSDDTPKFPFDNDFRYDEDWIDEARCVSCKLPFDEHNTVQLVECALRELGGKN